MPDKQNTDAPGMDFANFTAQTFLASVLNNFLYLFISIITARVLGPAGKGTVAVIILYPTLLYTVGHLSIYRAITVHLGQKEYGFKDYPGTVAIFSLIVSVLLSLMFISFYINFNRLFMQGVSLYIVLISLGILPCFFLISNFSSILQARAKIRELNIKSIFETCVLLSAVIFTLIVYNLGVGGAVVSYFVANLSCALLVVYFVWRISPGGWGFNSGLLKALLSDGAKLHLGVIASFITLRIDILMLAYYGQSSNVGFYSIAVSMAELLMVVPIAIQTVFYSRVSELVADQAQLKRKTLMVYKHSLFILLSASLLLVVFSRAIITFFYGRRFLESVIPFLVLLPGVFFLWLNNILTNYLVGMKKFWVISAISVAASLVNVYFNMMLIRPYGIIGAALASLAAYLLIGSLTLIAFFRVSKYRITDFIKEALFYKKDFMLYVLWIRKLFCRFFPVR